MQGAGQRAGEAPRKGGWVELLAGFGEVGVVQSELQRGQKSGESGFGDAGAGRLHSSRQRA